jgi:hypothetical protein
VTRSRLSRLFWIGASAILVAAALFAGTAPFARTLIVTSAIVPV